MSTDQPRRGPEVLPGWEKLAETEIARHVSLLVPRGAKRPDRHKLHLARDMLRQHIAHSHLRPFKWKRWLLPFDETHDQYVIGALCRAE